MIRYQDMPRTVEQTMEQAGLGDRLTRNEFIALHRRLVSFSKPNHDIASVGSYVSHFPPKTAREKVIIMIATAIEEAALNAREDSTHIDTVARARNYLGQVEDEIRAMAPPPPTPKRSRTREILAQHGYRRLGVRR